MLILPLSPKKYFLTKEKTIPAFITPLKESNWSHTLLTILLFQKTNLIDVDKQNPN